ncbi:MAG TPA: BlaI/MecI/CopY family transcriptional regulator [Chthonomonadaceae bacterium]|nr:BlaI/MecI/CopY family transcriptional regulator [Chthonomonadaceae bacterium]
MDRKDKTPKPTDAELSILRVLWRQGPRTVREVYEELSRERPMVYTTVLKLMQIMTEKGLVRREEHGRAHLYHATQSEENAQRRLVGDLLERAFGGSAQKLILQALTHRKASKEELAEIRRLLDELEGKGP